MQKMRRKPSDYPQFTFRTSEEFKERLNNLVDEVTNIYNKNLQEGEYLYRKNDIIAEALEIGLMQMKKSPLKKFQRKE